MGMLFSRKQYKFLDRLFFCLPVIRQVMAERKNRNVSEAMASEDPTARTAIAGMAPEVLERWGDALLETLGLDSWDEWEIWFGKNRYRNEYFRLAKDGFILSRYVAKDSPEQTCARIHISISTYWQWKRDTLTQLGFIAMRSGLKF